jgi:hypothetical protein
MWPALRPSARRQTLRGTSLALARSKASKPGALARAARQLARSAELPAYTSAPAKPPWRASGLALFMLAAGKPDSAVGWTIVARETGLLATELGRVHRARGELDRAQQIETELGAELAQIEAALDRERPRTGEGPRRPGPRPDGSEESPRRGLPAA